MKKFLIGLSAVIFTLMGGGISYAAAEAPDSYQVEVTPSTMSENEFVDLKVTAIKNGEVMKDYEGAFFISIDTEGGWVQAYDYVLPEDGLGELKLTDQGVKNYAKGLAIKKEGTYTISVEDMLNDEVRGETIITVSEETSVNLNNITIQYPQQNSTETHDMIEVIASAPTLPNSTIQVLLNGEKVEEGMTDDVGFASIGVLLEKEGGNSLELRVVNGEGKTIGGSQPVTFNYTPLGDELYKGITMSPNQNLKIGDKVIFRMQTDDRVSSVKLLFSDGTEHPMDKEKDGEFTKQIMLETVGVNTVNAELIAEATTKEVTDIISFDVSDYIRIENVRMDLNKELPGALDLSWDTKGGESDAYAILYGLDKDNLQYTAFTNEPQRTLTGFTYGKTYYYQITAMNAERVAEGIPSDIMDFEFPIPGDGEVDQDPLTDNEMEPEEQDHPDAPPPPPVIEEPTCVVKSIKVRTEKIGNKYFLVWDSLENIEKYRVYRSDYDDGSSKQYVGETNIPRFEYPFDNKAKEEVYAYYYIEGICSDGETLQLAEAEKVQVGPLEDIMLILLTTFLVYLMYKVYNYDI